MVRLWRGIFRIILIIWKYTCRLDIWISSHYYNRHIHLWCGFAKPKPYHRRDTYENLPRPSRVYSISPQSCFSWSLKGYGSVVMVWWSDMGHILVRGHPFASPNSVELHSPLHAELVSMVRRLQLLLPRCTMAGLQAQWLLLTLTSPPYSQSSTTFVSMSWNRSEIYLCCMVRVKLLLGSPMTEWYSDARGWHPSQNIEMFRIH
jgi:hypothetical protein